MKGQPANLIVRLLVGLVFLPERFMHEPWKPFRGRRGVMFARQRRWGLSLSARQAGTQLLSGMSSLRSAPRVSPRAFPCAQG